MKRILLILFVIIPNITWSQESKNQFIKGEIYLMFNEDYRMDIHSNRYLNLDDFDVLSKLKSQFDIYKIEHSFYFLTRDIPSLNNLVRLHFKADQKTNELIALLEKSPLVAYAERIPNNVNHDVPNDDLFGLQWYLEKINAEEAWSIHQGSDEIDVGIVDDSFYKHYDLLENQEPGWDVCCNDAGLRPDNSTYSHGTKVAGVVAATTNNVFGIASLGRNIDYIPIKSSSGDGYIRYGYEGIIRAAQEGAEIINMSWGNYSYSKTNEKIVNIASDLYGCILVASAGNDNARFKEYPASYENVIAVAASNRYDVKASFSNYGIWVDIVAPGKTIATTDLVSGFVYASGTSFSSPIVASLLGLVWSVNPKLSKEEVINCVLSTAQPLPWYGSGHGRIDAFAALQCATSTELSEHQNEITVFPNPTANTIQIASIDDLKIEKVQIIDSAGRIVLEYEGNRTNVYDLNVLEMGHYIMRFYANNKMYRHRIMKLGNE